LPAAQSTYIYGLPSLQRSATLRSVIQLKLLTSSSKLRCLSCLGVKNTYSSNCIVDAVIIGAYSSLPELRYLYKLWLPLSQGAKRCLLFTKHKLFAVGIVSKY